MSQIFAPYPAVLQQAMQSDDAQAVEKLIAGFKLDINRADKDGGSLLHWAASYGALKVAKLLLDRGADINVADRNGDTPLHGKFGLGTFAWKDGAEARFLMENGADINARNKAGETPLHRAVSADNGAAVRLAIHSGAEIEAKDRRGQTALHLACGASPRPVAGIGCFNILLAAGADANALADIGWAPLHFSAYWKTSEYVEKLLAHGADLTIGAVNAGQELTPFQFAVARGKIDLVALLVEKYGEDPAQRTATGRTLIQVARGKAEMQAYLRSAKTDLAIQTALEGPETAVQPVPRRSSTLAL